MIVAPSPPEPRLWADLPGPAGKLRETGIRTGLHGRMDKKLNAVVCPHPPLPLPYVRNKDQLEVGPIRIETIIDARVRLAPIAIDIPRIRLLRTEAAVDVDLLDPGIPKRVDGGTKPFQQPATPRRERETPAYLLQRCSMITRRQRTGSGVKRRNQATSIISETTPVVNIYDVKAHCHFPATICRVKSRLRLSPDRAVPYPRWPAAVPGVAPAPGTPHRIRSICAARPGAP